MGRPKQLLPLNGKSAIRRCVEGIIAAGVRDVVVVLGMNGGEAAAALAGLMVKVAFNGNAESEMAESVRIGLRETDPSASGVLVCLADHPLVSAETIGTLIALHAKNPRTIVVPCCRGRRGHPTLFPASLVREVFSGLTLRDVLAKHADRITAADVDDEGVVLDMDTKEDYERMRHRFDRT
jgi:molybdenum cofactor cytidylyltransferase